MANEQNQLSGAQPQRDSRDDELRELSSKFGVDLPEEEIEEMRKRLLHHITSKMTRTTYWWFPFQDSATDIFHETVVMAWTERRKWNRDAYPDLCDFLMGVVDNILYYRTNNWYIKYVSKVGDLSPHSQDSGVDHRGDDFDRASIAQETARKLANVESDFLKDLRAFLRKKKECEEKEQNKKEVEKLVQIVNVILSGASTPREVADELRIEKKTIYGLFERLRKLVNEYRVEQNIEKVVVKLASVAQNNFHLWLKEVSVAAEKDKDKRTLEKIAQVVDCLRAGSKRPGEIMEKLGVTFNEASSLITQLPNALSQYHLEKRAKETMRQIAGVKDCPENEFRFWLPEKVKESKDKKRGELLKNLLECSLASLHNPREVAVELKLGVDDVCKLTARLWELANEYQAETNAQMIARQLARIDKRLFRAWLDEAITGENGMDRTSPLKDLDCLVDCLGGGFVSLNKIVEKLKPTTTQVSARLEQLLALLNEFCADANANEIAESLTDVGVDEELRAFLKRKEHNEARLQLLLQITECIFSGGCKRPQEIAIKMRARSSEVYELLAWLRQLLTEYNNRDCPSDERLQPVLPGKSQFSPPVPQPAQ